MLSDTEMLDFNAAIAKAGFDPDDFNPTAQEDEPTSVEHQITGTVTIYRKSSDCAKTYRAGSGSTWPAEFETDLASGVFGRP